MSRQGSGRKVSIRLYMEGRLVENANAGFMVRGHTGAPATCQIEIVPTNTIKHILAGTWIHLFTTDTWEADPAGDLSDYKLLFEGVVIARGFTRQDDGRNFVIQCAGPEILWVEARQFWINVTSAGGGIIDQVALQTSGGYGRFGMMESTGTFGYMTSKLAKRSGEQVEERFLDTMVSVIDDIGNVNPFYTNARNRFRLTDRIIRAPAGKTEKLFELALLSDFLDGLAGRVSGQTNIAEVINQLLSAIMHEWVSVPAPPYLKTRIFERDVFGNIKRGKNTVKRVDRRGRRKVDLFDFKTAEDNVIGSIIFKPHVYTLSPPTCNVLFPNMYDQMSFNEDFFNEPTRLAMRPQLLSRHSKLTQGLLFMRPTELEIFTGLTRDSKKKTRGTRTPDAKYAGGESQTPNFNDYDWTTNEERIRGIVYNFINLAPAPSTLTLSDPGKKQPSGTRKGGMPKYLQNVASYEYYKSKFVARQCALSGPYNMRPVPGFPIVALDDSEANLNVVAYLDSITHNLDSQGTATTEYGIKYPRLADEVDFNRPKFKGSVETGGEIDFDLLRDENGNYDFAALFDGKNKPPIPEWFDEGFRNLKDLDFRYSEWFGEKVGVVENILFKDPYTSAAESLIETGRSAIDETTGLSLFDRATTVAGAVGEEFLKRSKEAEEIVEQNDKVDLADAIKELNRRFRIARGNGREFEEASIRTQRTFTTIDQAFRFVGAAPLEFADKVSGATADAPAPITFHNNPASERVIDYKKMHLDYFVGDVSAGSGYSGLKEGEELPEPIEQDQMSGAFPIFDTQNHTGKAATDQKTRDALLTDAGERAPSDWPRYDGRPLMFDFEFRLWMESLKNAGYAPSGEKLEDASTVSLYYVTEHGATRPATPEEKSQAAAKRLVSIALQKLAAAKRSKRGRSKAKTKNMSSADQAPTGDGLEQDQKKPLPQPLSEKQVIELRRTIVDAYREELKRTRGFIG